MDTRSNGRKRNLFKAIEKRKKELLRKYKTITKLKSLTKEELEKDLPNSVANELYNFLKEYKND